jgi:hypothetical protein
MKPQTKFADVIINHGDFLKPFSPVATRSILFAGIRNLLEIHYALSVYATLTSHTSQFL